MGPRKTGILVGLAIGVVIGLAMMLVSYLTREEYSCEGAARSGADLIETLVDSAEVSNLSRDLRENGGTEAERAAARDRITKLMDEVNVQLREWGEMKQQCPVTRDSHGL